MLGESISELASKLSLKTMIKEEQTVTALQRDFISEEKKKRWWFHPVDWQSPRSVLASLPPLLGSSPSVSHFPLSLTWNKPAISSPLPVRSHSCLIWLLSFPPVRFHPAPVSSVKPESFLSLDETRHSSRWCVPLPTMTALSPSGTMQSYRMWGLGGASSEQMELTTWGLNSKHSNSLPRSARRWGGSTSSRSHVSARTHNDGLAFGIESALFTGSQTTKARSAIVHMLIY